MILMRNNIGSRTVPWGTPPLTADQPDEEVNHPIYDGFINAKLIHFCYEHFVVCLVKCLLKSSRKMRSFSITIDVGVPSVEHIDEGINGGIPFL